MACRFYVDVRDGLIQRGKLHTVAVFRILLLLSATFSCGAETVLYTSFQGTSYELTPWYGQDVAVLTQSPNLDPATMNKILSAFDSAWNVYHNLTGQIPTPYAPTTLNGKDTIAQVPDGATCGAGCSYLGYTGTELTNTFVNYLYGKVSNYGQFDQVQFYEFGRNFWFYQRQLGIVDPFVTGFAIANRFVSMEQASIPGAPYYNTGMPFADFEAASTSVLLNAYLADARLNWKNTLAAGQGVPGQEFGGAADLAGAFFYKIYSDHGFSDYQSFFQILSTLPTAATGAAAIQNFEIAALGATGEDYSFLFRDQSTVPEPFSILLDVIGLASIVLVAKLRTGHAK
jgi:hypothetical protein